MALTTVNSDGVKDDSIKNIDIKSDAAIEASKLDNPLQFPDAHKVSFGTDGTGDLEIYHDNSNSYVKDTGTGMLRLMTNGTEIELTANSGSEYLARFIQDGASELYWGGTSPGKRFETTSGGAKVTGELHIPDGSETTNKLTIGDNDDFDIWHQTEGTFIRNHEGYLAIQNADDNINTRFIRGRAGEDGIKVIGDGAVELYWGGTTSPGKKFETNSLGATVTGSLWVTGDYIVYDDKKLYIGDSNDLQIYHDGDNSFIDDTGTGNLILRTSQLTVEGAPTGGAAMLVATEGGSTALYWSGTSPGKKFETSSTGATVTGNLTLTNYLKAAGDLLVCADHANSLSGSAIRFCVDGEAAAEKARIDSSGRLLLGTTTEGGVSADNITIGEDGNAGITIRSATNGSGNLFFSDATSGAGEYAGYIYYAHDTDKLYFGMDSADRLVIGSGGDIEVKTGNVVIGTAGKGIDFSATSDATGKTSELLDDYEEGTFTVSIGMTSTQVTISGTSSWTGYYVKTGNMCHVHAYISGVDITDNGSGWMYLAGLPFTSHNGTYCAVSITHNTLTAHSVKNGYVQPSNSIIYPVQSDLTTATYTQTGSTRYLMFGGTYRTA